MKETQLHIQDQVQIVAQVQQKKREFIGTLTPESGHTLFEFNKATKVLTKATFNQKNAVFKFIKDAGTDLRKEVIIKENCYYVSSLNAKNAAKKIHKQLGVAYVIHVNE